MISVVDDLCWHAKKEIYNKLNQIFPKGRVQSINWNMNIGYDKIIYNLFFLINILDDLSNLSCIFMKGNFFSQLKRKSWTRLNHDAMLIAKLPCFIPLDIS